MELRRIENVITEIVHDMEYLKVREQTMRNTNESTNDRVKGFAILTSTTPQPDCRKWLTNRSCVAGVDIMADYIPSNIL